MFTLRNLATVALFGVGFSIISSAIFVDQASAERKGYMDRTWNWGGGISDQPTYGPTQPPVQEPKEPSNEKPKGMYINDADMGTRVR